MKPYFNYSNFIIWWQLMLVTDIFILQYLGCSAGLSTFHQASLSKPPDPWWCAPAPLWCAITLLHNNLHLVCTRPSLMCTNLHGGVHQTFFGVHFVGAHALFTSQTFLRPRCVWTAFYPVDDDDDESPGLSSWGEPLGVYGQSFHSLMAHSLQRRPHAHWGHQKMHRAFAQLRHLMIQNLFLNSYFLVFGCVNSCIGSPQNI